MGQCPKCGYFRRPEDDEFVPASECPKCGVIYSRSRPVESLQAGFSSRPAEPARSGGGGGGVFKLLLLVVLAVAGFYGWRYYYPSSTEETVAYKSEFTAVPWFLDAPENTVVIVGPT